jgi:cytochrome c553
VGLNPARPAPGIRQGRVRVRSARAGIVVRGLMGLLCVLVPVALRAVEPAARDSVDHSLSASDRSAAVTGGIADSALADADAHAHADVDADALAAVCATCHRPDGEAIPVIHGRPAAELERLLAGFPSRTDVTVMHRLSQGLSSTEIAAVAQRLSEARRP